MLTDERQHAYKSNKSTIDVIYNIKRNLIKKQCIGQILHDISKAFGRIGRKKLRTVLYQRGLPINLIKQIKKGHTKNMLCSKKRET